MQTREIRQNIIATNLVQFGVVLAIAVTLLVYIFGIIDSARDGAEDRRLERMQQREKLFNDFATQIPVSSRLVADIAVTRLELGYAASEAEFLRLQERARALGYIPLEQGPDDPTIQMVTARKEELWKQWLTQSARWDSLPNYLAISAQLQARFGTSSERVDRLVRGMAECYDVLTELNAETNQELRAKAMRVRRLMVELYPPLPPDVPTSVLVDRSESAASRLAHRANELQSLAEKLADKTALHREDRKALAGFGEEVGDDVRRVADRVLGTVRMIASDGGVGIINGAGWRVEMDRLLDSCFQDLKRVRDLVEDSIWKESLQAKENPTLQDQWLATIEIRKFELEVEGIRVQAAKKLSSATQRAIDLFFLALVEEVGSELEREEPKGTLWNRYVADPLFRDVIGS